MKIEKLAEELKNLPIKHLWELNDLLMREGLRVRLEFGPKKSDGYGVQAPDEKEAC